MTVCPACGHDNREGRKFCAECGTALDLLACPSCGATNESGEKFCGDCGVRLTPTQAPAQERVAAVPSSGERKHITVLFADVAGSMDLQEQLDSEVWAQIMGRFVSILAEGVGRFGGTVDKFTGDGIMALFGAPVAQEDHARRACHAALHLTKTIGVYSDELRREQGVELGVRLGLNSGEVVVGRVGENVTLDPTALGHTVGLAQRMESLAEPGQVYLTEATARLARGWFSLEPLGSFSIKGAREPQGVYALGAPAVSPGRPRVGGSPLVGRRGEMTMLEDALAMAMDGQAQVVGVVGEAGVGKSRLCEEFAQSCRAPRSHRAAGGRRLPRAGRAPPTDPGLLPRLLRHQRRRRCPDGEAKGERPAARSRSRPRRHVAADVRFHGGPRSGPSRAAIGARGPHAAHLRRRAPGDGPAERAADPRSGVRGPPLVRLPERRIPGAADRVLSRVADPGGHELPARVLRRLDAALLLPPAAAQPPSGTGGQRAAGRAARRRPVAGAAGVVPPGAHRRQPVLCRGGGPDPHRGRHPGRRPGGVPDHPSAEGDPGTAERAGRGRRPHRPSPSGPKERPADRGGDRTHVRRARSWPE